MFQSPHKANDREVSLEPPLVILLNNIIKKMRNYTFFLKKTESAEMKGKKRERKIN